MGRQRTRINNTCSQILVTIKSTSGGILLIKKEDQVIEWSGLHYSFEKSVNMIELILLDSDSTDTLLCNPTYVSNIQDLDNPFSINRNGGLVKSCQKCNIPYINDVWWNEKSITNIISMKYMADKSHASMYSKKKLALLVHMPNKIMKFKQFLLDYTLRIRTMKRFSYSPINSINSWIH